MIEIGDPISRIVRGGVKVKSGSNLNWQAVRKRGKKRLPEVYSEK